MGGHKPGEGAAAHAGILPGEPHGQRGLAGRRVRQDREAHTGVTYGGLTHKPRQKTVSDGSAESPAAAHPGLSQTHLSGQTGCRATGPRSLSRRSHTYTHDASSCARNTAGLVGDHRRPATARPQVLRSHCRSGRSAVRRCSRMLPSEQPAWGRRGKGITALPSLSNSAAKENSQNISFHTYTTKTFGLFFCFPNIKS